jgi:hypothetical protein
LEEGLIATHKGKDADVYPVVNKGDLFIGEGGIFLLQVGKRRFLRVRGT